MKFQDNPRFQPVRAIGLAGLLVLLVTLPAPAGASRVQDLSLTAMAGKAGSIFSGRVSSAVAATVLGLPVTRVTFEVGDDVKGAPGESITLTLLGGDRPGGLPYRVPGLPRFRVGEEWVLLAYPPSSAGLTSPVGLFQGAFRVRRGAAGNRTVAIPGSRRALTDDLRRAGLMGGLRTPSAGGTAATRTTPSPGPAAGTTIVHAVFMQHLRDLVAGFPAPVSGADGVPTASAATNLEAAARARAAGTRP